MKRDSEDEAATSLEADPLSAEDRARVLSAVRLKAKFTLFVVTLLLGMSAMMFLGVTRVFDWLTPTIRHDLELKAQSIVTELSESAQLGMLVSDKEAVASASAKYLDDGDIVGLQIMDADGHRVLSHGSAGGLDTLFTKKRGAAHDIGERYGAWQSSEVEGAEVGRVAVFLSKARLDAGMEMKRDLLALAGVGLVVALVLSLLFVTLYIGPILRVTGQAFQRLEHTTTAALAATRLKSHFLANMSHEIRTPMNGIVGVLDLLTRTELSPRQKRYTRTIETSARTLLTIIDDILDFSKLEEGKYTIRPVDFDLRALAQEVVELLAPRAHEKGIDLVQRVAPDVPARVKADPDRLKQVLTNLIGNAIKFTEEGHVELRVEIVEHRAAGSVLRFSVSDTGIGIKAENVDTLFDMFSQVDSSSTRKHGGTGLGLAICKRLVERMEGTLAVDSVYGKGSTFWFTAACDAAEPHSVDPVPEPRDARILVVVPNEAYRDAVLDQIESWGMRADAFADAETATGELVSVDDDPYDAAVIDGDLPTADGGATLIDMCTAEGVPVVLLLSTASSTEDAHPAAQCVVLTKPARASELYDGIMSLLDGTGDAPLESRPETTADTSVARGSATILVVDDNQINRLVAVDLLTEFGYASDVATNGAEAVEKAARGNYAAILMDCQMPVMDGYQATAKIRELPGKAGRVPIIALTAHAMAGDREKVLAAGMSDYTPKPVRARALSRLLETWVESEAAPSAELCDDQEAPDSRVSVVTDLDPELPRAARVVELFLTTVPESLEELSRAVRRHDVGEVRRLAHKLKGGCLSLGAERMSHACHAVEKAATNGTIDERTVETLPELFAAVAPLLERAPAARSSVAGKKR